MSIKPEEIVTEGFSLSPEQKLWLANQVNALSEKGEGSARYEEPPISPTVFQGTDPDGNSVTIHEVDESAVSVVTDEEECSKPPISEESTETPNEAPADPIEQRITELGGQDAVSYADYATNDLEKYLESVDQLGFIELVSLKKQAEGNLASLNEAMETLDAIEHMNIEDPTAKNVLKSNLLQNFDLSHSMTDFKENGPTMKSSLEKVLEAINCRLEKEFPNPNSTRFLTDEMVSLLTKKKKALEEQRDSEDAPLNIDQTIHEVSLEIQAFSNRETIPDALVDAAVKFLTKTKPFKKAVDQIRSFGDNERIEKLVPAIRKVYSVNQIQAVYTYMKEEIYEDPTAAKLFLLFLDYTLDYARKNELSAAVKVFILNICDIQTKIFDLMDVSEYTKTIITLYRGLFLEYRGEI